MHGVPANGRRSSVVERVSDNALDTGWPTMPEGPRGDEARSGQGQARPIGGRRPGKERRRSDNQTDVREDTENADKTQQGQRRPDRLRHLPVDAWHVAQDTKFRRRRLPEGTSRPRHQTSLGSHGKHEDPTEDQAVLGHVRWGKHSGHAGMEVRLRLRAWVARP